MHRHVVENGCLQRVILKVHDPVSNQNSFQVEVVAGMLVLVVLDDPHCQVRDVFARIALPRYLGYCQFT